MQHEHVNVEAHDGQEKNAEEENVSPSYDSLRCNSCYFSVKEGEDVGHEWPDRNVEWTQ